MLTDKLTVEDVKSERSCSASLTRSKSRLPCGVGSDPDDRRWTEVFVPTFISYLGTIGDPWSPNVKDALVALQAIWDAVFHDKPHEIKSSSDPVYTTVCLIFDSAQA